MADNCIYKSVTLQAGESFTLPPGAQIISASNVGALTSTCPIPTDLEQPACYIAIIPWINNTNDNDDYWELDSDVSYFSGIYLNNIKTNFDTSVRIDNPGGLALKLKNTIPAILFSTWSFGGSFPPIANFNGRYYILIQTIPSIAENLEIEYNNDSPMPTGPGMTFARFAFKPLSYYQDLGYGNLPTCPTV